jgi:ATP-binding cassette subfamily B protein
MTKGSFIGKYLKGQRVRLLLVITATLVYVLLDKLYSLIFSFVIDDVIPGKEASGTFNVLISNIFGGVEYIRSHLWLMALLIVVIYLSTSMLMRYRVYNQSKVAESISRNIRNDIYEHLQLLPYSYHVHAKTGDLIQRCTSDIDLVRRFFNGQINELISALATAIFSLIIMYRINRKLSLFAFVSVPLILLYSLYFSFRFQRKFKLADEAEAELTADIQESLSGIRVVKAFNREAFEIDKFKKYNRKFRDVTQDVLNELAFFEATSYAIVLFQCMIIIIFGIIEARNGLLSTGNFFLFVSYQRNMLYPIRNVGRILAELGKMGVGIGRLLEIRNETPEDLDSGIDTKIDGNIEFHNVYFHYDDDNFDVLKDLNLKIKQGQTISIIGPTGSGKSSLVHLLTRLYDANEGEILIDGKDIKEYSKRCIRNNIGIVLQEPFLFSRSIKDNIAIYDSNTSTNEIERASRIASIYDVINNFDKGYDTLVGEKGVTLSGGQKQRVAIARTIIKNPPILIFDDSLSAVDSETDQNIRNSLKEYAKNITMIIITQRISCAMDSDLIYVIEDGTVSASGTHEQLIAKDGLYRRIYDLQSRMVIENKKEDEKKGDDHNG